MTPEDFEERNIRNLISAGHRSDAFGVSYVQRTCQIGYNQAMRTIERAVKQGILVKDAELDYRFRFASQ